MPSIELPASGRDCNGGWEMKLCPALKIDQARMIQISEGVALTPQEWQNLAINSLHHKDTQEKNKTKKPLSNNSYSCHCIYSCK